MTFSKTKWLGLVVLIGFSISSVKAQTADPVVLVAGVNKYSQTVTVTISDVTVGATIRYTTDGSTPTVSSTSIASGSSLTFSQSTTLKTAAVAGTSSSNLITIQYGVNGAISSSGDHAIVINQDGTVSSWGNNSSGQLGIGTTTPSSAPTSTLAAASTLFSGALPLRTLTSSVTYAQVDSDGDGLPDYWEMQYFGGITFYNGGSTPDGNGFTLLQDYLGGADPTNYYSQPSSSGPVMIVPSIVSLSGNNQNGAPSSFTLQPLVVQVVNSVTGIVLKNAPVTFAVLPGGGNVAATSGGTTSASLKVLTDSNGQAQIYYQQPTSNGVMGVITATTANQVVTFNEFSTGVFTSPVVANGLLGTNFYYPITANNTPINYAAIGLPPGLSLNTSTGLISGTPTSSGIFAVVLSAANSSNTAYVALAITINPPLSALPITLGLTAWYEADVGLTNSGTTTTWNDQSLNHFNLSNDSSFSPSITTDSPSGKPMAFFDNQWLGNNAAVTGVNDVSIVTVGSEVTPSQSGALMLLGNDSSGAWRIFYNNNGNQGYADGTHTVDGGDALPTNGLLNIGTMTYKQSTGLASFYTQGLANGTATVTSSSVGTGIGMGTFGPYLGWWGNVGEVIVYNRVLTTSERQQLETYLGNKYNIYASGAGWISNFSATIQTLIGSNHWNQSQALSYLQSTYPTIGSSSIANGYVGAAFSYTITASGSPSYYTVSGLPSGLSINHTTGAITGTPSVSGVFSLTLSAVNAAGVGQLILTLTVQPSIPVINSPTTAGGTIGMPFNGYTIVAGSNTTSYSATGLPATLTVNPTTGVITGTPTTAATYAVTLNATNSNGTGHSSLTLTIFPSLPVTSGLTAWYNASAGLQLTGAYVTQWNDQSSNHFDLSNGYAPSTPTISSDPVTGKPLVFFNNQWLGDDAAVTSANDVTIIAVSSQVTPSQSGALALLGNYSSGAWRIFYDNNGNQGYADGTSAVDGGHLLPVNGQLNVCTMTYKQSTGLASFYSQGAANGTTTVTSATVGTGIGLGTYGPYLGWWGNIAEVIVYNRVLTPTEQSSVESVLATRYGVYVPGASWISSYTATVQAEINRNHWSKKEADAYVALQLANPAMLTNGLLFWVKADAGVTTGAGSHVTGWADQAGNHSLSSINPMGQPTLVANDINGEPAIRFGGSQSLINPGLLGNGANADLTIISVGMTNHPQNLETSFSLGNETTGGSRILGYNNQSQSFDTTGSSAAGNTAPGNGVFAAEGLTLNATLTTANFYRNGALTGTGTISGVANVNKGISIGSSLYPDYNSYSSWQGDISEVLVYDHQLSSTELQQVSLYLASKYGLFYSNGTTRAAWIINYSSSIQSLIVSNQWDKFTADAYIQDSLVLPVATGLSAWFRADSGVVTNGDGQIMTWQDSSWNNNTLIPIPAGTAPTSGSDPISGRPVVQFNGAQSLSDENNVSSLTNVTIFAVASTPTPQASSTSTLVSIGQDLLSTYTDDRILVYSYGTQGFGVNPNNLHQGGSSGTATALTTSAVTYSASSQVANFYLNGVANGSFSGISGSAPTDGIALGAITYAGAPNFWTGSIAEVLIYNRVLNSTEIGQVQAYLSAKYSPLSGVATISPNGGNITTSTNITISGATAPGVIRYTLDGTQPTSTSTVYTGAFHLMADGQTVTCAIFSGATQLSPIASAQFWIGDSYHIGIPDAWQTLYLGSITNLNPNALTPGGSGLTYLQAYLWGYNPTKFSTNGDGLSDLMNHQLGYAGSNTDINGYLDGNGNPMTNAQQIAVGLDPFDVGANLIQPAPPATNPSDHTPPTITLIQPSTAILQ